MDDREERSDGWAVVSIVPTLVEARVVLALLESEGIEVRLEYDPAGSVILGPGSVNPWSGVTILVPEDRAERALAALEAAQASDLPEAPDEV